MDLSKDSLRILKLANKQESISFDDVCLAVSESVHSPYAPEHLTELENKGLVFVFSEMMPEGYEKTTIRISPAGQAELETRVVQTREKLITRGLSIFAIILSAISIIWQVLSSATPQ